MEYFSKRLASLEPLASKLDKNSTEGRVLSEILDILGEMGEVLDAAITEADTDADEEYYEYAFICPLCGAEVEVDEDVVETEDEIPCPGCGELIPVCATDLYGELFEF